MVVLEVKCLHSPQAEDGWFGLFKVGPEARHGTRSTHTGADDVDRWKLGEDLRTRPFDVRLPILVQRCQSRGRFHE